MQHPCRENAPPPFDTEAPVYFPAKVGQAKRRRKPANDLPAQIRVSGRLLEFKSGIAFDPPPPSQKGRRILGFSPSARLRLTKTLLTIDYEKTAISVFVTLTYPDDKLPRDKDTRQMDLSQFLRDVEKYLGRKVYGIWRTEWEVRKDGPHKGNVAPHFHLVLFNVVFIHYGKINAWWKRIISTDDYVRTEIKRARSKKKTLTYLAKYIKKPGEASLVYAPNYNTVDGKHYGYVRPRSIPRTPVEWMSFPSRPQIEYLYERHKELFPETDTRPGESFTIFSEVAMEIFSECRKIGLTTIGDNA